MFRDLDTLETRVEPKENASINFFLPLFFGFNSQQYGLNTRAPV